MGSGAPLLPAVIATRRTMPRMNSSRRSKSHHGCAPRGDTAHKQADADDAQFYAVADKCSQQQNMKVEDWLKHTAGGRALAHAWSKHRLTLHAERANKSFDAAHLRERTEKFIQQNYEAITKWCKTNGVDWRTPEGAADLARGLLESGYI
jgi:hypothetical protein